MDNNNSVLNSWVDGNINKVMEIWGLRKLRVVFFSPLFSLNITNISKFTMLWSHINWENSRMEAKVFQHCHCNMRGNFPVLANTSVGWRSNIRCHGSNSFKSMKLVKSQAPVLSIPYGFPYRRNGQSEVAVGDFISQNKLEAKEKNNITKILYGTQYNLINKLQSA